MAISYTTVTAPAVTALNSLASAAYWVSATFVNSTNLAFEVEIFVTILTTTTAGADGSIDVYVAGSTDGGTDFAGSVSGADATWTPAGDAVTQLQFLGTMPYTNETTARTLRKRFLISNVPQDFKLVIYNDTGTGFGATTCAVEWNSIKY